MANKGSLRHLGQRLMARNMEEDMLSLTAWAEWPWRHSRCRLGGGTVAVSSDGHTGDPRTQLLQQGSPYHRGHHPWLCSRPSLKGLLSKQTPSRR